MSMFREPENKGLDCRLFGYSINVNEDCPFQNFMDIYVVELGEGKALLEIPIQGDHLTPENLCHNGVASSLAVTAMDFAMKTKNLTGNLLEMNVQFSPETATVGDLYNATATIISAEGDTVVSQCEISTQKGEQVAMAKGTFKVKGKFI